MVLSEAEIEARLAALRRRREALDREIADHLLYLELGRRLRAGPAPEGGEPEPEPEPRGRARPGTEPAPGPRPPAPAPGPAAGPPPPVAFAQDPAAARRYGRALVEAAQAVLAGAGRPMHAGEILERLVAQGFTVPGQDPVAALNTRLWKRAGSGGPLRRLGEAVYACAGIPGTEEA